MDAPTPLPFQVFHKTSKTTHSSIGSQMLPLGQLLTIAIAVGTVIKENLDED